MKSVVRCRNECITAIDRACTRLGMNFEHPQMLSIFRYRPPKTNEQNAKMHVMWRELGHLVGHTEADMKEFFKEEYGETVKVRIGEKWKMVKKSCADYTKDECSDMIEHIYRVAAEAGYVLSDPQGQDV